MSTDWLNSHRQSAGLEPDGFLEPHKQGQGPTNSYAGPFLTDSSTPPWLFGNGPVSTDFGFLSAHAQPADLGSVYQHSALLPSDTQSQAAQQFSQERQDEVLHGSRSVSGSGSGSTACPSKPASSAKRSEAWNAKNRRAQKKFREKQKVAKNNMQQQLADMTAQLQKVETEHEQLTGRSAMLEQVLHSHQQQLNILHDQQQATQKQQSVNPQWQGQPPMPGGRLASGKTSEWALVAQPGAQPQTTDVKTTYAGMVEAMRDLVGRFERDGMSPELEVALQQQGFRVGMFIKGTVLSNSSNLRKLYLVNIDPETWDTTDMVYRQPEHWQAVTDCLQMTPEQKADMIRLRADCLAKQGENQARWHQLCNAIAAATARDPACAEHRDDMSLDTKRLMALKSTLQKGQNIWLELYYQVFKNVWTPIQYARAVAQSGPHHVDAMAIATCIAHNSHAAQQQPGTLLCNPSVQYVPYE